MQRFIRKSFSVKTPGDATGIANAAVTSTTGPPGTLKDTRRSSGALTAWAVDELVGAFITCNLKTGLVASNTIDTITLQAGWSGGGNPGNGNAYVIGGAGISAGQATIPVPMGLARFAGMDLDFDATAPALTTDVSVVSGDPAGIAQTLYAKANSVTDVPFSQFKQQCVDAAGVLIAGVYEYPLVKGEVKVIISQCNDLAEAVKGNLVFEII